MNTLRTTATLLALLASAGVARADDVADEADLHFELGAERYRARDYRGALEHFLASNRLVRNRNVLFNIARSYEQLGRFPDAHRYFSLALEGETDAAARDNISSALQRIAPNVAVLQVTTEPPGATIYIDRRDLGSRGTAPRSLAFAPGTARVIAELEGYETVSSSPVALRQGSVIPVALRLRRIVGTLGVEANVANAQVRVDLDNAPVACAAPCDLDLAPGRHTLILSADGYRTARREVVIEAQRRASTRVELVAQTGSVVVNADERGALVEVDGRPAGFTPAVLDLPVGRRRVRVSMEGFRAVDQELAVDATAQRTLDVQLRTIEEVSAASRATESVEDAPGSVSIVTGRELRAMAYPTIAEALRGVRGVYLSDDRLYPSVGFRGFGRPGDYGNRVLVLVDGHPTNDNWINSSYVSFDARSDLEDVERIEVVRGPGSVLYGTGAFSGVINLVTRSRSVTNGVDVGLGTNEFGVARARIGLRHRFEGDAGVWVSLGGAMGGGRDFVLPTLAQPAMGTRPEVPSELRGVDGFTSGTVTGRAWYRALTLQWLLNTRNKVFPGAVYGSAPGDSRNHLADTRGLLELRFEPRLSQTVQLLTRAFFNRYDYASVLIPEDDPRGYRRETFTGSWTGAELRLVLEPARWLRLSVGGEGQYHFDVRQRGDEFNVGSPNNTYLDEQRPFGIAAGYLSAEVIPSQRFRVSLGARADWYSTFGATVNPRLAVIFRPWAGGNFKVMGGSAFRAPSIYELFYNDGGVTQIRGDNLRPETIYSGEVEYTHRFATNWSALVTGYVNYIDQLIALRDVRPAGAMADVSQYANSEAPILTVGGEAEVRREWRRGWMFSASYSFQRSAYQQPASAAAGARLREVPNAPEHLFSVRAAAPILPDVLTGMLRLSFEGPRWDRNDRASDPAQQRTDPGLILDLVASGRVQRYGLRYAVGAYNVFDWRYAVPLSREYSDRLTAMPQSGRTLLVSVSAEFR